VEVTRRVATALACAALDPSLAGILLLDLDPALIYPLARWLKAVLADAPPEDAQPENSESDDAQPGPVPPGGGPPLIQLGPKMAEDTLWERFRLTEPAPPENLGFQWVPGRLSGYSRDPGIVVVPDLAWLGMPASRAAIALVGADVVHLERSGVSQLWRPRDRWLAALRSDEVDMVSAHLLDRFTLRVNAEGLELPWNPGPDPELPWDPDPVLTQTVRDRLGAALPSLSNAAADRVLSIIAPGVPGARRYLALGRLARALATLAGDLEVLPGHVDSAAELAGLLRQRGTARAWGGNSQNGPEDGRAVPGPLRQDGGTNGHLPVEPGEPAESEFFPEPDRFIPEPDRRHSYPEDTVQPSRDAPLLRVGWQRVLTGPPRGQPIGTQRALNSSDIAVAATLLNAAYFQRLRCPKHGEHYQLLHRLHLKKQDLLSYRRAPLPGQLLVLVLDHTCGTHDWDWYEPLEEYLGWAYVNRALVGVVEVGGEPDDSAFDAVSELRATQFQSRGVLDPRVLAALDRTPGRATPLAHGLSLAWELLRRSTQQGGPAVTEAILVVVTDAHANVPIADSKTGTVPANVGLKGFDDALKEARKIRALGQAQRRVRSVVIDPGWQPNGHLAVKLAAELRASLQHATLTASVTSASSSPGWPELASGGRDAWQ
jgi:magnesium chelatase subunit D